MFVTPEIYALLSPLAAPIALAITATGNASEVANDARKGVTAATKAYAVASAEAGVSLEHGRWILKAVLEQAEVKAGTIKANGNHFTGFRAILSDIAEATAAGQVPALAWDEATQKDAQARVAGIGAKRLQALRDAVNAAIAEKVGKGKKVSEAAYLDLAKLLGADLTAYTLLQAVEAEAEGEQGTDEGNDGDTEQGEHDDMQADIREAVNG